MAEVSAKDSSQETAIELIGMLLGMWIVPLIDSDLKTWVAFTLFTTIHLLANYKAVSCIIMQKLNRQRAKILMGHYHKHNSNIILTPKQISAQEKIVLHFEYEPSIRLGASLNEIISDGSINTQQILDSFHQFQDQEYTIIPTPSNKIYILLTENIPSESILKSYIHSLMIKNDSKNLDPNSFSQTYTKFTTHFQNAGWHLDGTLLNSQEWRGNKS